MHHGSTVLKGFSPIFETCFDLTKDEILLDFPFLRASRVPPIVHVQYSTSTFITSILFVEVCEKIKFAREP